MIPSGITLPLLKIRGACEAVRVLAYSPHMKTDYKAKIKMNTELLSVTGILPLSLFRWTEDLEQGSEK